MTLLTKTEFLSDRFDNVHIKIMSNMTKFGLDE